jgi:hypothetical protein
MLAKHIVNGLIRYKCRSCLESCVNHRTESCTRYRECQTCHSVPVLDRGDPIDQLHPSLVWVAFALSSSFTLPSQPTVQNGSEDPAASEPLSHV